MLAVMSTLSGEQPMELGTGSSVNSGSKCLRSFGPVWKADSNCFVWGVEVKKKKKHWWN